MGKYGAPKRYFQKHSVACAQSEQNAKSKSFFTRLREANALLPQHDERQGGGVGERARGALRGGGVRAAGWRRREAIRRASGGRGPGGEDHGRRELVQCRQGVRCARVVSRVAITVFLTRAFARRAVRALAREARSRCLAVSLSSPDRSTRALAWLRIRPRASRFPARHVPRHARPMLILRSPSASPKSQAS